VLVGCGARISVAWSVSVLISRPSVSVDFGALVISRIFVGSTTWLALGGVMVSNLGVLVADVFPQAKETKISATNAKNENRVLLLVLTVTLPF